VEGGKEFNEDRHDGGENGAGPSASARPSVRYCDEIVDDDGDNSASFYPPPPKKKSDEEVEVKF